MYLPITFAQRRGRLMAKVGKKSPVLPELVRAAWVKDSDQRVAALISSGATPGELHEAAGKLEKKSKSPWLAVEILAVALAFVPRTAQVKVARTVMTDPNAPRAADGTVVLSVGETFLKYADGAMSSQSAKKMAYFAAAVGGTRAAHRMLNNLANRPLRESLLEAAKQLSEMTRVPDGSPLPEPSPPVARPWADPARDASVTNRNSGEAAPT